jgi:hypothetical protein
VPHCPPQIPHGLARTLTRASEVKGRRLTTWAMAGFNFHIEQNIKLKAVPDACLSTMSVDTRESGVYGSWYS